MKTQKYLYTEVAGQIVSCEVVSESNTIYQLRCFCSDAVKMAMRVKSECFTNKTKAIKYFK